MGKKIKPVESTENNLLIPINQKSDIPEKYRNTPIELLFEYHNLNRPFEACTQAQLLIGMCMDNRKHMHMPDNFAFILRTGGANLRYSEFKVSYAVGVGGVAHVALIGHTQCGMVNLAARKEIFIKGLIERAGWERSQAEEQFVNFATLFEIGNVTDFIISESHRLNLKYPKVMVAPMIYKVEDSKLYLLKDD